MADPQSLHKYLYAHANPVMYWDPSGEMSLMEMSITVSNVGAMTTAAVISLLVVYAIQQVDVISIADSVGAAISEAARRLRPRCSAIIGETWDRVLWAKRRYAFAQILPLPFEVTELNPRTFDWAMEFNRQWIRRVKLSKCIIIDIGIDKSRTKRGPFYEMESRETIGYLYKIYDFSIPPSNRR